MYLLIILMSFGAVVEFHQHHLEEALQELELLVTEGQQPLEVARTAVAMIRARLDKEQESTQQRVATILTTAATVLSVLLLINKDAVRVLCRC